MAARSYGQYCALAKSLDVVEIVARAAKVGPDVEQVVLDAAQHRVLGAARVQPDEPDGGIGLVDGAVGRDAAGMLGNPRPVAERGAAEQEVVQVHAICSRVR